MHVGRTMGRVRQILFNRDPKSMNARTVKVQLNAVLRPLKRRQNDVPENETTIKNLCLVLVGLHACIRSQTPVSECKTK